MSYGEKNTDRGTVLIVDDVEVNRVILQEIIRDMGCHPVLADSGEAALEIVKECIPQLVLTDISMPGMNGYELCGILKKNKAMAGVPVIFISAHDASSDIVKGFAAGGGDYITKPFITEEVQARVGVHLRLYEMTSQLMEMNRRLQVSVSEQLKQMEQEKKNILYALADIASRHSLVEREHRERLRDNCRTLAQAMQLSPLFEGVISDTYIDTIEISSVLFDIGNIGVPVEILRKEAPLTAEEEAQMQSHTEMGAKLLQDLGGSDDYNDFISISADIARYHHENWDGSGYPEGLKGDEIPLAAQIVALTDRFCMLTGEADREDALAVLCREKGTKFNPDIVDICCKISRQLS